MDNNSSFKQNSVQNRGFALLLALIISSVVLAIGVSILQISVNQLNLSTTARESEFAFQAAHAGIDCSWYWRVHEADLFTSLGGQLPSVVCFGETSIASPAKETLYSGSDGHINHFMYTFEWGDPLRCTASDIYVMNAENDDLTLNFDNTGVGEDGVKECNEGDVCTVIVSRGYNRGCDDLSGNIFTVQREIVAEF